MGHLQYTNFLLQVYHILLASMAAPEYVIVSHDERTGKTSCLVGARGLIITWGDTSRYWEWRSDASSSFQEVAELKSVWWLDIRGRINTTMLSPHTLYSALLVFKLADQYSGLEQNNASVRFVNFQSDEEAERRALTVHLQDVENVIGQTPVSRGNGWMEVEIGEFYIQDWDDGEVEGRLFQTVNQTRVKRGLIVEGIEFRPVLNKILFLDRRTGKMCYLVGARGLTISWGDNSEYWRWTSDTGSRFQEVAELRYVWWLDIRGRINARMLSPHTMYSAFLVFKLADHSSGLEQINAIVRFIKFQPDEVVEGRALTVNLQDVENLVSRGNGWMEVEIGQFYIQEGDEGEVEGRLLNTVNLKRGLIVEGIEFRPAFNKILHGSENMLKKEAVVKEAEESFVGPQGTDGPQET
ncbi:UNVERIFIED_CONTAM: F-box protein PP2-B11 [Sesamum radiatum]|uniref:F-box protein PP2-B11 n=1 Tax=Sesamum radiatum TaxID=300843 RepID=A0AAW2QHN9_SESRA